MESRIYNAIAASSRGATAKKWLILDARGVELYRQGHIKGSVCVRLSSSSSTLVKVAGKAPFSANCWWGRHVLLVLPDSRKRKRHHDPVLQLLSKEGFVESLMILGPSPDADIAPLVNLQNNDPTCRDDPYLHLVHVYARHLELGAKYSSYKDNKFCTFSSFTKQYPFLITKSDKASLDPSYPSEILPHFLYLGNSENAKSRSQLDDLQISHVITIHTESMSFDNSIKYIFFDIEDEPTSNIAQCFEPANKFILDAETKGGRVLVHCAAGVSRSATLCAAYLMQSKNWNVEDTLEYLKQKRSQINPNQGFVSALHNYHKQISCLPTVRDVQSVVNPSSPSGDKDNGNDSGARFQLEVQKNGCKIGDITIVQGQPIVFGRASSCNIVLDHASISRQHAKMELSDQAVNLTDLKSSHGTFVNGQILQKGESISLNKSDKVSFGASSRYYILRD